VKQIGYITQGHSEYDPGLRELLDASGIDPEELEEALLATLPEMLADAYAEPE